MLRQQPEGGYRVSTHAGQTSLSINGEATLQGLAPGVRHQIVIAPMASDNKLDSITAYVTTRVKLQSGSEGVLPDFMHSR